MSTTVAVVGSGPSGLAAAHRLSRSGYDVTVYEARDYVGGKMRTVHQDGFTVEEGPSLVSTQYRAVLGIIDDVGLTGGLKRAGSIIGIPRGGQIHQLDCDRIALDFLRTGLLTTTAKLALRKLVADCVRNRSRLSDPDRLTELGDIDTETAADYARRRLGPEVLEYLVNPMGRALVGSSPEHISKVDLLYAWNSFLGRVGFVALREGMTSYAETVARQFTVELGAEVLEVVRSGSEAVVTWRDPQVGERTERYAGCVIATQAHLTAKLCPDLDPQQAAFLTSVDYAAMVNLLVGLDRPPVGERAMYLLPSGNSTPEILGLTLEHNKTPGHVPAGSGLLALYGSPEFSAANLDRDEDGCVADLLGAAEELLPGTRDATSFTRLCRWDTIAIRSRPGYYRELARFKTACRSHDNVIQLAGDYFAPSNVNSATAAGERAARDLVSALEGRNS